MLPPIAHKIPEGTALSETATLEFLEEPLVSNVSVVRSLIAICTRWA